MEEGLQHVYVRKPLVITATCSIEVGELGFVNNVLFILIDLIQINLFSKWTCLGFGTSDSCIFENVLVSPFLQ